MKNPGPVAQGRALTRLAQENRDRFRHIYVEAPRDLSKSRRRSWALTQLSTELPERYRALYLEEKNAVEAGHDRQGINPDVTGRASGPGPDHAVLSDGSATACGRIRFRTRPTAPGDAVNRVTCTFCIDEVRAKVSPRADPKFREDAATAEARIREFAAIQQRAASAREAAFNALAILRTPPKGTPERSALAALINEALAAGMTLREIGQHMRLTGERVRQIAAEQSAPATSVIPLDSRRIS